MDFHFLHRVLKGFVKAFLVRIRINKSKGPEWVG